VTTHFPSDLRAFDAPILSPEDRRRAGKQRREVVPRSSHASWDPPSDRRDPVEVLVDSNRGRLPELVPLRFERMTLSPFTFLRGSALIMAHDLAAGPSTDLEVRLCGDAHLLNFGAFASPERRLMFDLNDFDEASHGPFEWDVKRLAASVVAAARDNRFDARETRGAVIRAVNGYRDWMKLYAGMTHLEVWYARIEMQDLLATMKASRRNVEERLLEKAHGKDHIKALNKLTSIVDGRRLIVDDPPIVVHSERGLAGQMEGVVGVIADYRASLSVDRRELFDRYRFVDYARKVVGVGSVGTRCWIGLFQGPAGGPLFLQVKEARQSVISIARGTEPAAHFGQRVVEGQRMLQATGDILLGWGTDPVDGAQYYVRQLWDAKWSADVSTMGPAALGHYAGHCGWALARAHARTGDSVMISGYIGTSDRFSESIADWATAYADQNERDHAALVEAIDGGILSAS
jgi:uncharacterized protein (DUF2252 family)